MHEIRLAVSSPEEADVAGIATRLREATVEPCDDFILGPPEGCRAFLLARRVESRDIEHLLAEGVHVLVVADPCPRLEVIDALSTIARSKGVQFSVVNPERYLPSRQLLRRQIGAALGEPGLIRVHHWEPAPPTRTLDAGSLPDALLGDLDLTLWLAGRRPERVFAVEQKADGRYVQVHLGFPGGSMALLDYTDRLPTGEGYRSLSVIAANGAAYADDHQNMQLLYRGGQPHAVRTAERSGQLASIAQEFVDALHAGRDLRAGNDSWRDAFAVADGVRRSLASGRAVTLEDR